jgi:hypothetical protein
MKNGARVGVRGGTRAQGIVPLQAGVAKREGLSLKAGCETKQISSGDSSPLAREGQG